MQATRYCHPGIGEQKGKGRASGPFSVVSGRKWCRVLGWQRPRKAFVEDRLSYRAPQAITDGLCRRMAAGWRPVSDDANLRVRIKTTNLALIDKVVTYFASLQVVGGATRHRSDQWRVQGFARHHAIEHDGVRIAGQFRRWLEAAVPARGRLVRWKFCRCFVSGEVLKPATQKIRAAFAARILRLVEVAGIEPASEGTPCPALHA